MQQMLAKYICRYTCNSQETIQKKKIYFWNKTISEKCCLDSEGNVFKAGNIMNKIQNMDKCQSLILSRCTILPGEITFMITKSHFNCFWCLVHCIVAKMRTSYSLIYSVLTETNTITQLKALKISGYTKAIIEQEFKYFN